MFILMDVVDFAYFDVDHVTHLFLLTVSGDASGVPSF
jgi:hypothetical protein